VSHLSRASCQGRYCTSLYLYKWSYFPESDPYVTCFQCDEVRPDCGRCRRRAIPCPGYTKQITFGDEAPGLIERYRTKGREKNNNRIVTSCPSLSVADTVETTTSSSVRVRISESQVNVSRETFDEHVMPSLALKALTLQHAELFCSFVMATFPVLSSCFRTRVALTWMDYMRYHFKCAPSALTYAAQCQIAYYMGAINGNNQGEVDYSRYMYT
jgi:hypothetical protein